MHNPYQIYQQSSVQTATPANLIIMLYDGAIRFTKAGIENIQRRNIEQANYNLKKAQSIINELIASLNYDYEISNNLVRVYEYMLSLLIQANVKKDAKPAEEVLDFLNQLADTWKKALKMRSVPEEAGIVK
jgi:flagellar secretion chaperone FliS